MIPQLLKAFADTIKPQTKLNIVDWAAKYVKVARSSRSEYADLTQTKWLIEPIETIIGNSHSEIIFNAPVGSGKTTMLEILGTYIIAEKPGPTLFGLQTDADASEWFATGLLPAIKNCELIKPLMPTKRTYMKKDFYQFAHMPLWVGGSGISNLQSKSCQYVFLDEAWLLRKSLMEEARRRTHDRFGSKTIFVSQAGLIGDDLDQASKQCFQKEFNFLCPSCNQYHPYSFSDLKWTNKVRKKTNEIVWSSLECWYECPGCGKRWEDTVKDRREMAQSGAYVDAMSDNPLKGHINFHFTALSVWWIEWRKLVIQFLKATADAKRGSFEMLRQFNQKRLALPWNDMEHLEKSELKIGHYTLEEAKDINFGTTILCVDVQKQDLWYTVRTWSKSGESKLLEANKVVNFQSLIEIVNRYKLKSNQVFIDSAYRTEEVKSLIAKQKWLGLNGRPEASYPIKNRYTGKTFRRLYSMPNSHQTSNGNAIITYYSSNSVKDILFILKQGHGAEWGVPEDIGKEYIDQLNSEVKVLGANNTLYYKKIKVNNHFLDTEAMQIVAAQMHNCYPQVEPNEDSVTSTGEESNVDDGNLTSI